MANLIDFNIIQLAIMIACVQIMDVIIFQNMVASIYLLLRRICVCYVYFLGEEVGVREASTLAV